MNGKGREAERENDRAGALKIRWREEKAESECKTCENKSATEER